jgi:protein TonB
VHLELRVAQRLKNRLDQAAGAPQQGFLFGRALDGITEILDFDPLANGNLTDVLAALPEDRKGALVGYYRTEPGETLRLNANDLMLADGYFAKPHQVFLLVQSGAFGAPNAAFFFHKNDQSMADFPFLEFPLDPDLLAMEERDRLSRSRSAVSVQHPPLALPEPEPVALVPATQPVLAAALIEKPRRSLRKSVAWVAFGGFLGASAVALGTPSVRERGARLWTAWSAAVKAAPPTAPAVSAPAILGLVAQRQTSDVQLTWNRESSSIAAATSGILSIEDGAARREIPLSASQIHSGSVLYSPASGEVTMQLTVTTPAGPVSESVLVVLSSAGPLKTYPLSSPESTPLNSPSALVVKPSKPFAGNAVVISSSPEAPPDLTEPPPVAANPPEASVRMPAVEAPQPQAPPPVQQQAPLPSPEPTATVPISTPIAPPQPSATTSNYTPPRPISKAAPKFPVELKTHVTKPHLVEVRVSIDEHGRVTRADAVPQKGITEFFVEATVSAARLWRFEPARRDNQPVASEMTLQFLLDR